MMNKLVKLSILAVIILIIFMDIMQYKRVSSLEEQIKYHKDRLNQAILSIDDMEDSVITSLKDFKLKNQWIRNWSINYKKISKDFETITLVFSLDFNTLKKNSKVYLRIGRNLISNPENIAWEKIELHCENALHFKKEINLSMKENYTLEIIAEDEDSIRSAELGEININDDIMERIDTEVEINTHKNGFNLFIVIHNSPKGNRYFSNNRVMSDILKFKTAKAYIYVKDKLFREIDLLRECETENSKRYEIFEYDEKYENILIKTNDIKYEQEYENHLINEEDIKIIIKAEDKLGIVYEKEAEIEFD